MTTPVNKQDPIFSASAPVPQKRSWAPLHQQLHSSFSTQGNDFYKTRNICGLTSLKATLSAKYIHQNASFLSIFSEPEIIFMIECIDLLFKQNFSPDAQKLFILWCKRLKESLGDIPFHLLIEPKSLLVPVSPKSWSAWVVSFFSTTLEVGSTPDAFIGVMQKLIEMSNYPILPLLEKYHASQLTLKGLSQELDLLKDQIDRERFPEKELSEVLSEFNQVSFPLPKEKLALIFDQYQTLQELGKKIKSGSLKQWSTTAEEIRKRYAAGSHAKEDVLLLLSIAREAMGAKYGIYPYNTQILTVLGLLAYPAECKGSIAQVYTGEGKSTITTLLAFIHACQGKTVDIISSSRYLAQRDAKKYACFFEEFQITTSHICADDPPASYFRGQILYGTNYDFEFALMHDELRAKQNRLWKQGGQLVPRAFEVAIVDEVDNLFIDSALNSARIAIPALQTTEWMYSPILAFVQSHKETIEKTTPAFLQLKMLEDLRQELRHFQKGLYQKEAEAFTDQQLIQSIDKAYQALYVFKEKQDYIIQCQKKITIVDWNNTGRLKEESRWQDGLHQFLEAKHDLEIQRESLTVASLCHPVYFNLYQNIYGLTGTLGEKIERDEVEKTYDITSFDVPSHRKNLRRELPPLITSSQEAYDHLIFKEIEETQQQERPILILCETIQASLDFSKSFQEKGISFQLLNELQKEKEDFIIARAGEPRSVTIATNTAGRGTDIILNPSSRENGGLHVILTFFPQNDRIKNQGFGRSARQGEAGSCRLILQTEKSLSLLLSERSSMVEQTSLARMENIKTERSHYQFLALFWEKLQQFHHIPAELFTIERLNQWLEKIRADNRIDADSLRPIEKLTQNTIEGACIQESLGNLAQQYWAHFFYDRLSNLDDTVDIEDLYHSCRPLWESIFEVPSIDP